MSTFLQDRFTSAIAADMLLFDEELMINVLCFEEMAAHTQEAITSDLLEVIDIELMLKQVQFQSDWS
tara:strand:+ start:370 stop:570 length:201 start_codon:yes stop_codon:yes gene_type:complete